MGIINVTEDSFFADSRSRALADVVSKASRHLLEGAAILDIGAQSTRPGATKVGADQEMERLLPAITAILKAHPEAIISIDTFYASVAACCVKAGAAIINDISAGDLDEAMIPTVGALRVPYIAMHMQGSPDTMQQHPHYENVVQEVLDYFIQKLAVCKQAGMEDVIVDPGFGFGKTIAHNYTLLRHLAAFRILEAPLLAGVSRKSMIYKVLGNTASDALNGTTVIHSMALERGARLLRVHDVKAAMEAVTLYHTLATA
ncbi:dihydropteroate synthase [Chitinophaga costaii]|nr:dihydropteroate synthase [Chitinophaga costaii]